MPDNSVDFVFDNHGSKTTPDLAMRKLRAGGVYLSIVNTQLAAKPKPGVTQMYFERNFTSNLPLLVSCKPCMRDWFLSQSRTRSAATRQESAKP